MSNNPVIKSLLEKTKILSNSLYGHNVLQATAPLKELFSQLVEIANYALAEVKIAVPDINIGEYCPSGVDPTRANICFIKLPSKKYCGIIANSKIGTRYKEFSNAELMRLVADGHINNWHLITQLENILEVVESDNAASLFTDLIAALAKEFIYEHENSSYHLAGKPISPKDDIRAEIEGLFALEQIQESDIGNSPLQINQPKIDAAYTAKALYTASGKYFEQVGIVPLSTKEFSNADLSKIGFSKYLLSRLNATTFSKDIHTGSTKYPRDIFVYYTDNIEFGQILDPDDYIVECSLEGTLGIAYKGDSKVYTTKINAKPMVMYKESTKCRFIIPVKIDSTNTRRVEKIDTSQAYISYRIYGKIQEH